MTITVRFAELRDRDRCEELLNLLVGNTAASEKIFSGQVFKTIVAGRHGRVLLACEDEFALGMASMCTLKSLICGAAHPSVQNTSENGRSTRSMNSSSNSLLQSSRSRQISAISSL